MNKKYFFLIIFLLIGVFFVSHFSKNSIPSVNIENIKYVKIGGQDVKVDLALTETQQATGLSGRQGLATNEGMLFVFNKPDKYSFWMKDMNFPIDIIWITEDMKIIYIKKDALPSLYPETYGPTTSDANAKYVLETIAGFSDKNNLKIGDNISFL